MKVFRISFFFSSLVALRDINLAKAYFGSSINRVDFIRGASKAATYNFGMNKANARYKSKPPFHVSPLSASTETVAYRSLSVTVDEVTIPVASWYPVTDGNSIDTAATYEHSISVSRIAELLAGWNFVPSFISRRYELEPTFPKVIDGSKSPVPLGCPVALVAHGYLGSRFDLSHLAESLAQQGFLCLSPEFPESLAASFPRSEGLDREKITSAVLAMASSELGIPMDPPPFRAAIGHSLGCLTVARLPGSWVRICIAGFVPGETLPGDLFLIASLNDGLIGSSPERLYSRIPEDLKMIDPCKWNIGESVPSRAAAVFGDTISGPNHISFLAGSVNKCMIDFLSPLLPLAQALSIPVLDFDKYKVSQDSKPTAEIVIPLILSFLKQRM